MNYFAIKSKLKYFLIIALGAVPGALIRWQINNNLLVNFLGSLILGFVIGARVKLPAKLLIGVGFCGSVTTFSGWVIKCFHLLIIGNFLEAIIFIILSLLAGLIAAYIGFFMGERMKSFIFDLNNSFF
tara:strand:+ start:4073 stop:4456 length:384 start_codon:yes stop_codon:yes gene_type:complete